MGETVGMARETKVGLLAGLAFIICFAVILSNRGRTDLVPPNHSMIPQRVDLVQSPGSGLNLAPGGLGVNTAVPAVGSVTGRTQDGDRRFFSPDQAALQSMTDAVRSGQSSPSADSQRALEERLARLEQSAGLVSIPSPQPPSSSGLPDAIRTGTTPHGQPSGPTDNPPSPTFIEYTVKPGDTLWRIAQTQCGSGAKSVIDTILDLNRDRISNANSVHSGVVLRLPRVVEQKSGSSVQRAALPEPSLAKPDARAKRELDSASKPQPGRPKTEGLAANTSALTGKPPASANDAKSKTPEHGYRWYQVKKNDRYASIARDVLGDGDRWDEIYAMNKDKFPDPNRIREGVRIKVPVRK